MFARTNARTRGPEIFHIALGIASRKSRMLLTPSLPFSLCLSSFRLFSSFPNERLTTRGNESRRYLCLEIKIENEAHALRVYSSSGECFSDVQDMHKIYLHIRKLQEHARLNFPRFSDFVYIWWFALRFPDTPHVVKLRN